MTCLANAYLRRSGYWDEVGSQRLNVFKRSIHGRLKRDTRFESVLHVQNVEDLIWVGQYGDTWQLRKPLSPLFLIYEFDIEK